MLNSWSLLLIVFIGGFYMHVIVIEPVFLISNWWTLTLAGSCKLLASLSIITLTWPKSVRTSPNYFKSGRIIKTGFQNLAPSGAAQYKIGSGKKMGFFFGGRQFLRKKRRKEEFFSEQAEIRSGLRKLLFLTGAKIWFTPIPPQITPKLLKSVIFG